LRPKIDDMTPVGETDALDAAIAAIVGGYHRDPFAVLGPHHATGGGIVVRAFHPAARAIELHLIATGALLPMERRDPAGLFEVRLARATVNTAFVPSAHPTARIAVAYVRRPRRTLPTVYVARLGEADRPRTFPLLTHELQPVGGSVTIASTEPGSMAAIAALQSA